MNEPTQKQKDRIHRLVSHVGEKFVVNYFERKYPNSDYKQMTKEQAQKIITGLQTHEPRKPIFGVVGRDVY